MSMYACPKSCIHQCFHTYVMHATCQTLYAHVSVSTKSMGLVGVECFLYIRYILLNILMIECQAVFYISEKNMLFTRSVLDFFFFFILSRQNLFAAKLTWNNRCSRRGWNNLFFWGERDKRNKKQIHIFFVI